MSSSYAKGVTSSASRVSLTIIGLFAVGFGLSACAGATADGTYYGTAGDTALIINADKTCKYTQSYDAEDGIDAEDMTDCTWTKSDSTYTFAGISKGGTIIGTLTEDGSLSLPSQGTWNGEIYTKE